MVKKLNRLVKKLSPAGVNDILISEWKQFIEAVTEKDDKGISISVKRLNTFIKAISSNQYLNIKIDWVTLINQLLLTYRTELNNDNLYSICDSLNYLDNQLSYSKDYSDLFDKELMLKIIEQEKL